MKLFSLLEVIRHFVNVKVVYFAQGELLIIAQGTKDDVDSDIFLLSTEDWKRRVLRIWIVEGELVILVE